MKIRLRKDKLAGGLGLLLALGLIVALAVPALAIPPQPHQFYGTVTIDTALAPEGTIVSARIGGLEYEAGFVDAVGRYGYDPLFKVPADDPGEPGKEGGVPGETVDFYITSATLGIYGVKANETAEFEIWGVTNLNLTVGEVTYSLTMAVAGNGTVTPLSGTYSAGDMTITATAASGWEFAGWSTADMAEIAAPSSPSTTLTLDKDKTVTATFVEEGVTYDLTMAVVGNGTVTPLSGTYPAGGMTITATAASGWEFAGWSTTDMAEIAAPSSPSTTLTLDKNKTVTATFVEEGVTYDLTIDSTAGGEVTEPGEGVFPGYAPGTVVNLLAVPEADFLFVNWTGETGAIDDVNAEDTFITMTGNYAITANFVEIGETNLTVNTTPGGTVTDPGVGTFPYDTGTVVDLVAEPDQCASFVNWTGEVGMVDDINAATTTITMNDDYTITANFAPPEALMEIDLGAGWNTFSTPIALDPCSNTWGGLLALSELDDVEIVYDYDVSTQYWGLVTTGDAVKPLDGFYVKLSDESLGGTVPIIPNPGATPPPSKDLSTGLNLIGPASLVDRDVVSSLIDIYEITGGLIGYSKVLNPPINVPNDFVDDAYVRNDPFVPTIVVGKAYWVIMVNPGTLYGFTSTPLTP